MVTTVRLVINTSIPHVITMFLCGDNISDFLLKILFIFRQRRWEGKREGEKHQGVVASCAPHIGDPACNTGMCPRPGVEPATPWLAGQCSIH